MIENNIEIAVRRLTANGIRYFGAGGALGFDMLASECVIIWRHALHGRLLPPPRDNGNKRSDTSRRLVKTVRISPMSRRHCLQKKDFATLADNINRWVCGYDLARGAYAASVEMELLWECNYNKY